MLRDVLGRTRADKTAHKAIQSGLQDIRQREDEQRQALDVRQQADRDQLGRKQQSRRDAQARGIDKARGRAASEHAKDATQRAQESAKPPAPPSPWEFQRATRTRPRAVRTAGAGRPQSHSRCTPARAQRKARRRQLVAQGKP